MNSGKKNSARRRRGVKRMFNTQDGKCCYCGQPMWLHFEHPDRKLTSRNRKTMATVEHIIPTAMGGSNRKENLILSCYRCNQIRGIVRHELFLKLVEMYGWNDVKSFCVHVNSVRSSIIATVSRRNIKTRLRTIKRNIDLTLQSL